MGRPKKIDPDEQRIAVLNKIFSESVEAFARFFFPHHLSIETPPFHKEIYRALEDEKRLRIAVASPRGHAKSTLVDLAYLAWVVVNKKAKFIILVSDTYSQSVLFLEALKAEFEDNDKLKLFYGNMGSKDWSEGEIVVNGIMVKALGAQMKVRGLKYRENRPDLIVIDDLENEELVESVERREKLERWFNGALVPSLAKNGRIVIIGTILHYDSLLYKILNPEGYREYFKKTYRAIISETGKALWPQHLNLEELNLLKSDYIEKGQAYLFYQEYMNEPISDENRKFKMEKMKFYTEDLLEGKNLSTFIAIDRAYSLEKTADFTGIVVVSVDSENNWYVRQAERFKGVESELIQKIMDLKAYWSPIKIGVEQKAYQFTIKVALEDEMRKRNSFFSIEELKDYGQAKAKRIEGLLPRYESGSIYFLKKQKEIMDEMFTFPRGVHDDLIDALAHQLNLCSSPFGETYLDPNFATYGTSYRD
jgi:phage terminase large subunit-like protein